MSEKWNKAAVVPDIIETPEGKELTISVAPAKSVVDDNHPDLHHEVKQEWDDKKKLESMDVGILYESVRKTSEAQHWMESDNSDDEDAVGLKHKKEKKVSNVAPVQESVVYVSVHEDKKSSNLGSSQLSYKLSTDRRSEMPVSSKKSNSQMSHSHVSNLLMSGLGLNKSGLRKQSTFGKQDQPSITQSTPPQPNTELTDSGFSNFKTTHSNLNPYGPKYFATQTSVGKDAFVSQTSMAKSKDFATAVSVLNPYESKTVTKVGDTQVSQGVLSGQSRIVKSVNRVDNNTQGAQTHAGVQDFWASQAYQGPDYSNGYPYGKTETYTRNGETVTIIRKEPVVTRSVIKMEPQVIKQDGHEVRRQPGIVRYDTHGAKREPVTMSTSEVRNAPVTMSVRHETNEMNKQPVVIRRDMQPVSREPVIIRQDTHERTGESKVEYVSNPITQSHHSISEQSPHFGTNDDVLRGTFGKSVPNHQNGSIHQSNVSKDGQNPFTESWANTKGDSRVGH